MNPIEHPAPLRLSAFVDGELLPEEMRQVQQHLAECPTCALQVVAAMRLKAATARASQRFGASPASLARLTAGLRKEEPKKTARVIPFKAWVWAAMAASILVAVLVFEGWQTRQGNRLQAEVLDEHLAVLSSGAAPEVISTDRHTVKPWFAGKLPFSFNLPETLPSDMALEGGDLTYLEGRAAALLLFRIGKHQASVFVTQRSEFSESGRGTASGFSIMRAG